MGFAARPRTLSRPQLSLYAAAFQCLASVSPALPENKLGIRREEEKRAWDCCGSRSSRGLPSRSPERPGRGAAVISICLGEPPWPPVPTTRTPHAACNSLHLVLEVSSVGGHRESRSLARTISISEYPFSAVQPALRFNATEVSPATSSTEIKGSAFTLSLQSGKGT